MVALTAAQADRIADAALGAGVEHRFAPRCAVVLDTGGHALVVKRDEWPSIGRVEIATGTAHGCLAIEFGARELARRADTMPKFFTALANVFPKGIVPVPGGVLDRERIVAADQDGSFHRVPPWHTSGAVER
jgi:uncharacterized protein GlcG (DUF336 family)